MKIIIKFILATLLITLGITIFIYSVNTPEPSNFLDIFYFSAKIVGGLALCIVGISWSITTIGKL